MKNIITFISKRAITLLLSIMGVAPAWMASAPARAADYALTFDGSQSVETQITGDKLAGDELTIEYWFKGSKMLSAVRIQDANNAWLVAGWGGGSGPGGAAPMHLIKTSSSQDLRPNSLASVQDGNWHHVAMTYKRNTANGIVSYVDGNAVQRLNAANEPVPTINGKVWLGALNGTQEFLAGALDEVRIWKRALSDAEILDHARNPRLLTGFEASLAAYFPFNDSGTNTTRDVVGGLDALLKNITPNSRVAQTGVVFAMPGPAPASAGLWLGEVSLQRVSEVPSSPNLPTAAGGVFDFNIILHADSNGVVRLLKDVTIMQKRNTASNVTDLVLLTDDTLIPNYDGLIKRSGKLVGARYSSAFYQFSGQWLPVAGGLGLGSGLAATNTIPSTLPTNPFFHKFHPNHKNPTDLQGMPYDLTRQIQITFANVKRGANDGRDKLEGAYRETITGLHKAPLIAEGAITLQRVSLVNKLNNQ